MSDPRLAGQVASDIVNGLKHSPALLAIIVLNLLLMGGVVWFMARIADTSKENFQILMRACLPQIEHRDGRQ